MNGTNTVGQVITVIVMVLILCGTFLGIRSIRNTKANEEVGAFEYSQLQRLSKDVDYKLLVCEAMKDGKVTKAEYDEICRVQDYFETKQYKFLLNEKCQGDFERLKL